MTTMLGRNKSRPLSMSAVWFAVICHNSRHNSGKITVMMASLYCSASASMSPQKDLISER